MLNKQLKTLIAFAGLSDEACAVKVAKAYLADCFGIGATIADLEALGGYLPPVCRNGDTVGVRWKEVNYPLQKDFRTSLSVTSKETKEKQSYFVLTYAVDQTLLTEAEATYEVPVLFANVASRALNTCFQKAEDGLDPAILPAFQFGRLNEETADGEYKVVEVQKLNKGVVAVCDLFTVYFGDTQSKLVVKGGIITVVKGEAFVDNAGKLEKVTSGGVDCKEIPTELGWSRNFIEIGEISNTVYTYIVEEGTGDHYWCPLAVTKVAEATGSRNIGKFSVTVTGTRKKDDKEYPVVTVKPVK